jgi:hypothetical protein
MTPFEFGIIGDLGLYLAPCASPRRAEIIRRNRMRMRFEPQCAGGDDRIKPGVPATQLFRPSDIRRGGSSGTKGRCTHR